MASLEIAFKLTMLNEDRTLSGRVTNDPAKGDPGAVARFGVNSAAHPKAVADGLYRRNPDGTIWMQNGTAYLYAADIFKYEYFSRIGGYQIKDQSIANKYVDIAFEAGVGEATLIVQRACNRMMGPLQLGLEVDGKCGQRTIDAVNSFDPGALLVQIKSYAKDFYEAWAFRENKPPEELAAIMARVNS